jgi:AraC-like DNA-binding protein
MTTPNSPFECIITHDSTENDLMHLVNYEEAAENIWVGKIDHRLNRDIISRVSGPATFCLTFFFEGNGCFSLDNGQAIQIESNTVLLFYSPGETCGTDRLTKDTQLKCLHLRFPVKLAADFEKMLTYFVPAFKANASTHDSLLASVPMNALLKGIAQDIFECKLPAGFARQLYLQAKALESLAYLVHFLEQDRADIPLTLFERQRIYQAVELINEQYDQAWTISSLAKTVGLNEKKLKTGFKSLIRSTVHGYLERTRLTVATEMLKDGKSITETALATGYANPSHFSKYFKKHYHMPPREWLKLTIH